MYQVNDYVVYRTHVCQITQIKSNYKETQTYYELTPLIPTTLIFHVPALNPSGYLRAIISKEDALHWLKHLSYYGARSEKGKELDRLYQTCMSKGTLKDVILVYVTSSNRIQERKQAKKKISERERLYYERSSKCLIEEFSLALQLSLEETSDLLQRQLLQ